MAIILEIREHSICIIQARKAGAKVYVKNTYLIQSPNAIIDKGLIVFGAENEAIIHEYFKKNKIHNKSIDVVINDRLGITRDLFVPKTDPKKTTLIVENEMANIYNLERDHVIDYRGLKSKSKDKKAPNHVLVTAVSHGLVESLERQLRSMKLKIRSIDLAQSSFLKLVESYSFVKTDNPAVVVELGSSYVRSYLFDEKELKLMRTIYFYAQEPFKVVMDRLFQVIDMMEQSYFGKTKRNITDIVVLGSDLYVPRILQHYADNDDLNVTIIGSDIFAKGRKHAASEYLASLGVLL